MLLRPQHLKPTSGPLPAQAADLEINLAPEMDKLFANNHEQASLFYHEPQKTRLASFDLKSPFGAANTYTWLVSQMSPSGHRNRRRFVHSLATLDAQAMFDGGWLLPLGQEESLKDILSVYRLLPGKPFETVGGEFQPVTIRTLIHERQTYVYLVNDSPWDVNVSTQLELPAEAKMEKLGDSRGIAAVTRNGNLGSWKISLRPYDLVAARFSSAPVRLRNPTISISDQVRHNLQRRIQDLARRVAALANPQPLGVLENPYFELAGQGDQIRGWLASVPSGASVSLDAQQKHGGAQSLKLVGDGQPVSIVSTPFAPPVTGRLAVEMWLRGGTGGLPSVRIALEGQLRDGKFDPYGIIPAVAPGNAGAEWVRYSFPVDDVPSEGLANVSVRLDLLSAGEVWVDDVQIFDLPFNDGERLELSKLISLASVKLEAGQLADCSRLLDGYWPQFLLANVPLTQSPIPLAQRPRARLRLPRRRRNQPCWKTSRAICPSCSARRTNRACRLAIKARRQPGGQLICRLPNR